jgi:hypothetical protein
MTASRTGLALSDDTAVQAVADQRGDHPHIQNVRAHHQQAAVLEEQRLNGDHRGHNQDATPRTEGDCRQDAAQQVTGRSASNRKVDHLRGKDERRHDPQERRLPLIEVALGRVWRQVR